MNAMNAEQQREFDDMNQVQPVVNGINMEFNDVPGFVVKAYRDIVQVLSNAKEYSNKELCDSLVYIYDQVAREYSESNNLTKENRDKVEMFFNNIGTIIARFHTYN